MEEHSLYIFQPLVIIYNTLTKCILTSQSESFHDYSKGICGRTAVVPKVIFRDGGDGERVSVERLACGHVRVQGDRLAAAAPGDSGARSTVNNAGEGCLVILAGVDNLLK